MRAKCEATVSLVLNSGGKPKSMSLHTFLGPFYASLDQAQAKDCQGQLKEGLGS